MRKTRGDITGRYNATDLHVHSTFSTQDGLGDPKSIVKRAKELGWGAVCLTEHGWMGSAPFLYKEARKQKIKPILGCEFYIVPPEAYGQRTQEFRTASHHLTVLALNFDGYRNLVHWCSLAMQPDNFYYRSRISLEAMIDSAPASLRNNVILSGCMGGELCQCLVSDNPLKMEAAGAYVEMLKAQFPNFYIELQSHRHDKFYGGGFTRYEEMVEAQAVVLPQLVALAEATGTPTVLTNDSHFQSAKQRQAHIAMMSRRKWHKGDEDKHQSDSGEIAGFLKDYIYFCVTPQTRVLTKNLQWVEADNLYVGQKLWGFDENLNGDPGDHARERNRRYRECEVTNAGRRFLPCYQVEFDNGDIVTVSENHPWLACEFPTRKNIVWKVTSDLKIGDVIPQYLDTWDDLEGRDAGWLAGIWDGEGSTGNTKNLVIAQRDGIVLDKIKRLMSVCYGTDLYEHVREDGCHTLTVNGSMQDRLSFLGSVRPERLIDNFNKHLQGSALLAARYVKVVSCKPVGDMEVVTLSTSTRTFFAEGYGAHNTNYMQSLEDIADAALPVSVRDSAIENVHEIVKEVDIRLDPIDNFRYSLPFSGYEDPLKEIRQRSQKRLSELRKKHGAKTVDARFEREMGAMGDFAHYLMLMSDFLTRANEQGILTSLRGSAANSIVCYCLDIHDIDSIEYMLAFERFVNPARKKFPDIDIDIEAHRRDEFLRIVNERMEETGEGSENVRLMCTYSTLANRATFRLVAGALGMSEEKQDEIAKLLPQMIDSGLVSEEDDLFEALKEDYPELYELSSQVFDSVTKVSQHACGYLFGTRERPLADWVPEFHIASSKQNVTQFNAAASEMFGLIKMDFLKLETLSVMKKVMQQVGLGNAMLSDIPLDDPDTYEMLRQGKTAGVHSMQGKTQRRGCMEVMVENIHDVVAVQALYRPSGTRTGFTDKFCARRRGDEPVAYPNRLVEDILGITYGLPIYQEQVLEIGYAVGMTDLEVEEILKAIKVAKGVGRGAAEAFANLKPMFMRYATKLMQEEDADNLWALFDAFQGYGFNRGHATAYAILAVRSAYLKCHYPAEFFSALLDVFPERQDYVASVKAEGFVFEPPDVNRSGIGFMRGEQKNGIRVGLTKVEGVGQVAAREIERKQPFRSVDDMLERCASSSINAGTVKRLGPIGALKSLGVRATASDGEMLRLIGLLFDTPKAFDKIDEVALPERGRSSWKYKGLVNDVYPTAGKAFVSKLFWIPDEDYTSDKFGKPKKILDFKATPWAQAKTHLLFAVDENGLPFEIHVNEKKEVESGIVKVIAERCRGKVICLDGRVSLPFMKEHPMGFSLWGVTGAESGDPQMWENDEDACARFVKLAAIKARRRA